MLGFEKGGSFYYFITDGLSSVRLVVDESGDVVASYDADEFGNPTVVSEDGVSTDQRWVGGLGYKDETAATGLYYLRQRYYSPDIGRLLSRDPFGISAGLNLYHYANARPIQNVDPTGNDVEAWFFRAEGTLLIHDNQTDEWLTVLNVWSGNNDSANDPACQAMPDVGPLPAGKYLIGNGFAETNHPGDNWWYPLYGSDGKGGFSATNIPVKDPASGKTVIRGNFYLHAGRASDGCVTVWSDVDKGQPGYPKSNDYNSIKTLLEKTSPKKYKGSTYRGVLHVE